MDGAIQAMSSGVSVLTAGNGRVAGFFVTTAFFSAFYFGKVKHFHYVFPVPPLVLFMLWPYDFGFCIACAAPRGSCQSSTKASMVFTRLYSGEMHLRNHQVVRRGLVPDPLSESARVRDNGTDLLTDFHKIAAERSQRLTSASRPPNLYPLRACVLRPELLRPGTTQYIPGFCSDMRACPL